MTTLEKNGVGNTPALSGGDWYLYFYQEIFYAFQFDYFLAITPRVCLTPVPGSIDLVLGVMNVDDDILTVLDIPKVIGSTSADMEALQLVIVTEVDGQRVGIPATHVVGKVSYSEFNLESRDLKATRSSYVHQLACRQNQPVTLLALDKILQNQSEKDVMNANLFLEP